MHGKPAIFGAPGPTHLAIGALAQDADALVGIHGDRGAKNGLQEKFKIGGWVSDSK